MKYILVTDTHLGRNQSNIHELNQTLDLFNTIINYTKENNITKLIHLGDFFDNKKYLTLNTIHYSNLISEKLNTSLTSYFILGNHDIYNKNQLEPYSSIIFNNYSNINVITKPITLNNVLLLPWFFNKEDMIKTDYCMGHFEMNGPIINQTGRISQGHSLNISDFSQYKMVFSGHYHTPGIYNNIHYIGSPYHQDFNDTGERGFYVFDSDTGEYNFIQYNSNEYKIIDAESNFTEKDIKNNVIRLEFHNNIGDVEISNKTSLLESYNPLRYKTKFLFSNDLTEEIREEDLSSIGNNKDILYEYINKSDTKLNKDVLYTMIEEIQEK